MAKHDKPAWLTGPEEHTPRKPPWHPVYRPVWLRAELQLRQQSDDPPPSTWIETEIDVGDGDEEVRAILYRRRSRALPVNELFRPSRGNA